MDKLEMIINERPAFHRGETEIDRPFALGESLLSSKTAEKLAANELTCYGIGKDVLSFIADNIQSGSKTLETGAGCSTLIFALLGSDHIAVTPSHSEIELITQYAISHEISMETINFVQQPSEQFLPRLEAEELDLVLLDGKHAFPWPIIDWFFTADKLKQGGLMIIDDAEMKSVSILVDFMKVDSGWQMVNDFAGKTIVFKKMKASVHDVAWHMQRYTMKSPFERITSRLKQIVIR
ncbi:MAG: class I SAM-dependent methyltransferase [Chitinophagaceae bacterium]